MEFPYTFNLTKPVIFGDETIESLIFREPTAGDMVDFEITDKVKLGSLMDIASAVSGQPPAMIKKLSVPDALSLAEVVGLFFDDGQPAPAS